MQHNAGQVLQKMMAQSHPHSWKNPSITGHYEIILRELVKSMVHENTDERHYPKAPLNSYWAWPLASSTKADLACTGWLEFHKTEPKNLQCHHQFLKNLWPQSLDPSYQLIQHPISRWHPLLPRWMPSNQLVSLLCSKNSTSIFRSLVSRWCWSNGRFTWKTTTQCEPGECILQVWLQGLEFTSTAMFSRDLSWQGQWLQGIRPQSNHLVWGSHCPGTNLALSHRPSGTGPRKLPGSSQNYASPTLTHLASNTLSEFQNPY